MREDRPLRVLHAIHSLVAGGAETQLRLLLNSGSCPGVQSAVFFLSGSDGDITNPEVRLFPSRYRSTRQPGYLRSLYQAIDAFDPDVVQTWLPAAVSVPAMLIGRLQGRAVLMSYRGRRSLDHPLSCLEVIAGLLCADRVVSNHEVLSAPSYAGSVFRWLFRRKNGLVIRNGIAIDASRAAPAPLQRDPPFRLICVGRLTPPKNYPLLVQAMGLLAGRRDWTLDIWGEGECRPEIERAIAASAVRDRIRLRGNLAAVAEEMTRAFALILPSTSEGMPNVLLEAMALGLPVIAADIDGVREIVGGDPACVWIDPRDPQAIARGIAALLDGNANTAELIAQGRRIADRYTIRHAQAAYAGLYEELLRAR